MVVGVSSPPLSTPAPDPDPFVESAFHLFSVDPEEAGSNRHPYRIRRVQLPDDVKHHDEEVNAPIGVKVRSWQPASGSEYLVLHFTAPPSGWVAVAMELTGRCARSFSTALGTDRTWRP